MAAICHQLKCMHRCISAEIHPLQFSTKHDNTNRKPFPPRK